MNCRTDNCPNPVPRLDELCAKCRRIAEELSTRGISVIDDGGTTVKITLTVNDYRPVLINLGENDGEPLTLEEAVRCRDAIAAQMRERWPDAVISTGDIYAAGIKPGELFRCQLSCDGEGNVTKTIEAI